MHIHAFFYVYILECADGTYYTGFTSDIYTRLNDHTSGRYPGSYTYDRRPVKLMFYQSFTEPDMAILFEKKIKKWSHAKKKALIEENYHLLPPLSKKKF